MISSTSYNPKKRVRFDPGIDWIDNASEDLQIAVDEDQKQDEEK